MPTYNQLDLISRALRETGYLSGTAVPNAQDQLQASDTLNGMLDSWKIDPEFIAFRNFDLYALTGVQSYDIGPSAAAPFNVRKPPCIINANIVDSNGVRVSHLAIIDDDVRAGITVPNIPSSLPGALNYKRGNETGVLTFYPKPGAGYRVELETWADLPEFTDLTTPAVFPNGYYDMLVYGLAQRFGTPGWGRGPSATIDGLFGQAKQRVLSLNLSPTPLMAVDPRSAGVRQQGTDQGVSQYWIDGPYVSSFYR